MRATWNGAITSRNILLSLKSIEIDSDIIGGFDIG